MTVLVVVVNADLLNVWRSSPLTISSGHEDCLRTVDGNHGSSPQDVLPFKEWNHWEVVSQF